MSLQRLFVQRYFAIQHAVMGDKGAPASAPGDAAPPPGTLAAVRSNNLFTLDGHLLNRAGPRMVLGTAAMCEVLEQARQRRPK